MKEYIQNIIFILGEAIENEDWELVSEAKNLLENVLDELSVSFGSEILLKKL